MSQKKFDLNIKKILEDWESFHAVREIIANALDEKLLSGAKKDIEIYSTSEDEWHIRDYGRGLRYEHLTQNENEEKLKNANVIGKFGIGLKDALATLHRKNISVLIKSKYGDITLGQTTKQDFDDIITLHAYISDPSSPDLIGTDFILKGITKNEIDKAKKLFHKFVGEPIIETTPYGDILEKKESKAVIYINGVKVAEEDIFLFSYNITSLNAAIRKALNRERTNVGRSAYTDRVKSILLSSKKNDVSRLLIQDLNNFAKGSMHDELKWLDVQDHAVRIMNATNDKVVFVTTDELMEAKDMIDEARDNGYIIVTVPENLKSKIQGSRDISGNKIRDLGYFAQERQDNFKFKFVDPMKLSIKEKQVYDSGNKLINLLGGFPKNVKEIRISETMVKDPLSFSDALGLYDEQNGRIIIKREQLEKTHDYLGTLLHELAHAISGASDVSRTFELELTRLLGLVSEKVVNERNEMLTQPSFAIRMKSMFSKK